MKPNSKFRRGQRREKTKHKVAGEMNGRTLSKVAGCCEMEDAMADDSSNHWQPTAVLVLAAIVHMSF